MTAGIAQDAPRALLHSLAQHIDAADLLPILDAEREWLVGLIEFPDANARALCNEGQGRANFQKLARAR